MLVKNLSGLGLFLCALVIIGSLNLIAPAHAQSEEAIPAQAIQVGFTKTITFSMEPQATISPLMYGVNYVWGAIPKSEFPSWIVQMQGTYSSSSAFASLARYPGGVDGEWYDWSTNTLYSGGPTYTEPGVTPGEFLSSIQPLVFDAPLTEGWLKKIVEGWFKTIDGQSDRRSASFLLSTRQVITTKNPADIPGLIIERVNEYCKLIGDYHKSVKFWEIGNEWWLQAGAGHNTAPLSNNALLSTNLTRYAAIISLAAPVIKATYPDIKIYVTADWTTAGDQTDDDEFIQLRKKVGETTWALIDGISIHPYCGITVEKSLCSSIPEHVAKIKEETGKDDIYASEWSIGDRQFDNNFGIRNANATVSVFQDLALAGITKASYWPSMNSVPTVALAGSKELNATGLVFQKMSLIYEGQVLATHISSNGNSPGNTMAVAAKNKLFGQNGLGVIIPSNGDGLETIDIPLAGTGLTKVVASEIIYSDKPDVASASSKAYSVPLNVSVVRKEDGDLTAEFTLNPGTSGRGSNWEIAVLELQ